MFGPGAVPDGALILGKEGICPLGTPVSLHVDRKKRDRLAAE